MQFVICFSFYLFIIIIQMQNATFVCMNLCIIIWKYAFISIERVLSIIICFFFSLLKIARQRQRI